MVRRFLLLAVFLTTAARAAEPMVEIGPALAQTRAFAGTTGESLWPGYGSAPFGFLLLEPDREILLCRPGAPSGFEPDGDDPATGCPRLRRARTGLPAGLLAAMPMFGPPAVIVMGTPTTTGRSRASWLRTILHEHFHQWQWSLPDYYGRVEALDLAGGDKTGMWMLNFPFPYESAPVGAAYAAASNALADALEQRGRPGFAAAFDSYLAARRRFAASVSTREWRYLDFQLWQEGAARWSEIQLGKAYPDQAVRDSAVALEKATLASLRKPDLKAQGRELAYPFGAGEAMLMSACGPQWRDAYPKVLGMTALLETARRSCPARRHS